MSRFSGLFRGVASKAVTALALMGLAVPMQAQAIELLSGPTVDSFVSNGDSCEITFNYEVRGIDVDRTVLGVDVDQFRLSLNNSTGRGLDTTSSEIPVGDTVSESETFSVRTTDPDINGSFLIRVTETPFAILGEQRILSSDLRNASMAGDACSTVANRMDGTNTSPVADAGADETILVTDFSASGTEAQSTTLRGSGSNDPDGSSITYNWELVSGPSSEIDDASLENTTITQPSVEGTQVWRLTVTDSDGASDTDEVSITWSPRNNQPPVAVASVNGEETQIDIDFSATGDDRRVVRLVGNASSDPDNNPLTFQWEQISGPTSEFETVVFNSGFVATNQIDVTQPTEPGTQVWRLTVDDGFGGTDTAEVSLTWLAPVTGSNTPPVADAGEDVERELTAISAVLRLSAQGSSDADNDSLSYSWVLISGPVSETGSTTSIPNLLLDVSPPAEAGVQVWELTVDDGNGGTDTDRVTVTWTSPASPTPNTAPVADAGEDVERNFTPDGERNPVTLFSVGSSDAETIPDLLIYNWTLISGPNSDSETNSNNQTLNVFPPLEGGVQVWELSVEDPQGAIGTDRVSITWIAPEPEEPTPNTAPIANAGEDVEFNFILGARTPVTLFSVGSSDAETIPGLLIYNWTLISGPNSDSETNSNNQTLNVFPPSEGGVQVWELSVEDPQGAIGTDRVSITWIAPEPPAPNIPPVAVASDDVELVLVEGSTAPVTLNAVGSSDEDDNIPELTFSWSLISGPFSETSSNSAILNQFLSVAAPSEAGIQLWELTVTDPEGATDTDRVTITWTLPNTAPIADAGEDISNVEAGDLVTLSATGSVDPDGDDLSYVWEQLSGPTVTLTNADQVSPSFTAPAVTALTEITFMVTVSDPLGLSGDDEVTVSILGNTAPIADAGEDISNINAGDLVTLSAAASSDPEGDALTYLWEQISGPTVTLENTDQVSTSFTAPSLNSTTDLSFRVSVSDRLGLVDEDEVTVSIQPIGTITLVQRVTGSDNDFGFSAPILDLDRSLTTVSGIGQLRAEGVVAGLYTIIADDMRDAGYALTALSCDDTNSTANLSTRTVIINLSPGEDVTCTFESVNSREAAQLAIAEALTQRNSLLLSNQPSSQRRLDRLNGKPSDGGGLSIASFQVASNGSLPFSASLNERGGSFSTSLSQVNALNKEPSKRTSEAGQTGFDVWGEATFAQFQSAGKDGQFGLIYLGADYVISDKLLIGGLVQLDSFETDSDSNVGDFKGDGFMVGPYATARLSEKIYVDGRLAWGSSNNDVAPLGTSRDEFETDRSLVTLSVTGDFNAGKSIKIRPTLGFRHISETQNEYDDSFGVRIPEQKIDQGELSFAPHIEKRIALNNGWTFNPYGTVEGIVSFGDEFESVFENGARARIEAGGTIRSESGVRAGISAFADGIGRDNFDAQGIRISFGYIMK